MAVRVWWSELGAELLAGAVDEVHANDGRAEPCEMAQTGCADATRRSGDDHSCAAHDGMLARPGAECTNRQLAAAMHLRRVAAASVGTLHLDDSCPSSSQQVADTDGSVALGQLSIS